MIILLLIVALAIVLFWAVLQLDIPGLWQFLLIFTEMVIVGQLLIKRYKLPSELGMILVKSKRGIEAIEELAKKREMFHFMTDIGNVIAYGLSSRLFLKKGSVVSLIAGLGLLAFISLLVAPSAFVFLFEVVKIGTAEKTTSMVGLDANLMLLVIGTILLLGGLASLILAGIIYYGGVILYAIVESLFFGADSISTISPGGTFLLPGVNLPLFEGILALVVVMVVHEGAHAALTRIAKVPLLSSGIVLFGIIPVGAFIEPDEEKLAKVEEIKQTRVLIAGPTSNLITSAAAFVLFMALVFTINSFEVLKTGIVGDVIRFVYTTLGLTFALNFVVGAVNLLPLPLFDGFRVFDINVKNKNIVKAVMYTALFFFILNFLPWFFR